MDGPSAKSPGVFQYRLVSTAGGLITSFTVWAFTAQAHDKDPTKVAANINGRAIRSFIDHYLFKWFEFRLP